MPCKKLTIAEHQALPPNTQGYPANPDGSPPTICGCNPCPCTTPLQCCTNGTNNECLTRLTTGTCNSILFRRTATGGEITPGFTWMVQPSGAGTTYYTNETPSPTLAEQYCPGTGYWHITSVVNQNPCGMGFACFLYYRCIT